MTTLRDETTRHLQWRHDEQLPHELKTTTHARRLASLRRQLVEVRAELDRRAALPPQVICDECGQPHDASYSHEGRYGEGAVYEVVCGGLSDYYLSERLVAR